MGSVFQACMTELNVTKTGICVTDLYLNLLLSDKLD